MTGRSHDVEAITSRFAENNKREAIGTLEIENRAIGIKIYTHPVSMLAKLQPKVWSNVGLAQVRGYPVLAGDILS